MRQLSLTFALLVALTTATAAAQSDQLTISTSPRMVVYGKQVRVSGTLSGQPAGSPVIVAYRPQGRRRFVPVSNSTTGADGSWSFTFEPTVRSELQARSGRFLSRIVTIRVKPRLTLTRRRGALFARAVAARSFRGRFVWFQRRSGRRWHSVRKVVLDDPPKRFEVKLPKGISRVRVSLPRRQAGAGYEPTVSRVLVVRRR